MSLVYILTNHSLVSQGTIWPWDQGISGDHIP